MQSTLHGRPGAKFGDGTQRAPGYSATPLSWYVGGMRILKRDGQHITLTPEQLAQIEEYTKGKTLSEVAAEGPLFAHFLNPPKPSRLRRAWAWLVGKFRRSPESAFAQTPRRTLEQYAWMYGVESTGRTDAELRRDITARMRCPY